MSKLDEFDLLVDEVGGFGRYQKLISLLLLAPMASTGAFALANVFNAAQPEFQCQINNCDPQSSQHWNFAFPKDSNDEYDFCSRYVRLNNDSSCLNSDFSDIETERCDAFVFSKEHYSSSVVTDFDLVCDNAWKVPMTQTVFFVTTIFTPPLMGQLATWLGRKPTLMLCLALMSLSSLVLTLANSFEIFVLLQVPMALSQCGVFQTGLVLLLELVDRRRRVFGSIAPQIAFTFGVFGLTLAAYLLKEWRRIQLAIALPTLLFVVYSPFLPESPRWLWRRGKIEKAKAVLNRMARINGRKEAKIILNNNNEDDNENKTNKESLLDVFRWPILTLRMFLLFYVWMAISMGYYGLSLNTDSLAGDPYVNFALTALVEIPGYALSIIALDKVGRKALVGGSLIFSSLFMLLSTLTMPHSIQLSVYLLGKTFITCSFGSVFLMTSELYPTSIRAVGVGVSNAMARVGSTLAPQVSLVEFVVAPILVFAAAAFVAGLVVVLGLPETAGRPLPDHLGQAAAIGNNGNEDNKQDCGTNNGGKRNV